LFFTFTSIYVHSFTLWYKKLYSTPGTNPTIASYKASVVNFYNATTGSLARFGNKNIFFFFEKRYCNAGVVAVNSKVVGLATGSTKHLPWKCLFLHDNIFVPDTETAFFIPTYLIRGV
jgi:hypothetical protein